MRASMGRPRAITLTILAVAAAGAFVPCRARAQSTGRGPFSAGFGGGVSVPAGSLGEQTYAGWNAMVEGEMHPDGSVFGLRLDASYDYFGLTRGVIERFPTANAGDAHVWSGTANLVVGAPHAAAVSPYLIGGGGIYGRVVEIDRVRGTLVPIEDPTLGLVDAFIPSVENQASFYQTKPGFNAGAGIAWSMMGVTFFVEARYTEILTTPRVTIMTPITLGLRY